MQLEFSWNFLSPPRWAPSDLATHTYHLPQRLPAGSLHTHQLIQLYLSFKIRFMHMNWSEIFRNMKFWQTHRRHCSNQGPGGWEIWKPIFSRSVLAECHDVNEHTERHPNFMNESSRGNDHTTATPSTHRDWLFKNLAVTSRTKPILVHGCKLKFVRRACPILHYTQILERNTPTRICLSHRDDGRSHLIGPTKMHFNPHF